MNCSWLLKMNTRFHNFMNFINHFKRFSFAELKRKDTIIFFFFNCCKLNSDRPSRIFTQIHWCFIIYHPCCQYFVDTRCHFINIPKTYDNKSTALRCIFVCFRNILFSSRVNNLWRVVSCELYALDIKNKIRGENILM